MLSRSPKAEPVPSIEWDVKVTLPFQLPTQQQGAALVAVSAETASIDELNAVKFDLTYLGNPMSVGSFEEESEGIYRASIAQGTSPEAGIIRYDSAINGLKMVMVAPLNCYLNSIG